MMWTTAADWHERYAAQLGTPEEAVSIIEPRRHGLRRHVDLRSHAALRSTRQAGRRSARRYRVDLTHSFNWDRPEILEHYRIRTLYAGR